MSPDSRQIFGPLVLAKIQSLSTGVNGLLRFLCYFLRKYDIILGRKGKKATWGGDSTFEVAVMLEEPLKTRCLSGKDFSPKSGSFSEKK